MREVADPEYSLAQETNEFLTRLSQSLSDENDGLIAMARDALGTLKQLLGLPEQSDEVDEPSTLDHEPNNSPPTSQPTHEHLAHDLHTTLQTLASLLTNPNFVSVEEVAIRDDEIARLRDGWETMESRWKEVLAMMDGWRARIEKSGDTINLADLKRGLGLLSLIHI